MDKQLLKENIKKNAVQIFSEKGFHGTSIREIAKMSECSLPMLYYYYKNKEELFYEIAYTEFVELVDRLNSTVIRHPNLKDTYFEAIKQKKQLSSYDKALYKLSLKVWLGFEGDTRVRSDLIEWEKGRLERTNQLLKDSCENIESLPVLSSVIVRVIENLTERIILFDENISDEEVKKEINFLMESRK